MDFQLTGEQEAVHKTARDIALKVFMPVAAKHDREETFPLEEWKIFAQQGWVGMWIPNEYGGTKLDAVSAILALEEFSRVDPGMGLAVMSTTFGSGLLKELAPRISSRSTSPASRRGKRSWGPP